MQRGLGEQNWAWIVIACCAVILRRALRDKGGLVSSVKVAPGEQILISVRDSKSAANAGHAGVRPRLTR